MKKRVESLAGWLLMAGSKDLRGHLAALFTISVWGVTFINIKLLLVDFSPVEIMFYRLLLALGALYAAGWIKSALTRGSPADAGGGGEVKLNPGAVPEGSRERRMLMAAGLCGVTLYFLFQNMALTYTLAANVSVLISVAPLFTALLARFLLKERLKANFFAGFAAAISGIALIAFNGSLALELNPLGDLLSLLAAGSWALYVILVRQIGAQMPVLALTRRVFTYGFLFMLPVLPLSGFEFGLQRLADPANLFNLAFLGLVGSALCFGTWNYAVTTLGAVKTSVYIYAIPVVTVFAAALALDERITLTAGVGMALILAGMAISEREKAGRAAPGS